MLVVEAGAAHTLKGVFPVAQNYSFKQEEKQ